MKLDFVEVCGFRASVADRREILPLPVGVLRNASGQQALG